MFPHSISVEYELMTMQNYSFILMRGLVREAEHWGPFVGLLKESYPGSDVHCIDIPGSGIHFQDKTPPNIESIVQTMRQELLTIPADANKPRVLIAVSLGGMISAQWFASYPDDFKNAVLINTSYAQYSPPWKRMKPQALKKLLPVFFLKGQPREEQILKVVSNRADKHKEISRAWAHIHQQRPVSLANSLRQLKAAFQFKGIDHTPTLPVLLLGSIEDQLVSYDCMKAIAHAWKAPLISHPSAGHDLTTDDPQWAVDKIQNWLVGLN